MALQKALLPVGFTGLNQLVDDKTAPIGTFSTLDNVTIDTNHQIKKRPGVRTIGSSTTPSNIYSMYTSGSETGVITDSALWSYSSTLDKFLNKGTTYSPVVTSDSIIANTYSQNNIDSSNNSNGIFATVWEDSRGGVRCTIKDITSNTNLINDYNLSSSGVKPRVIATNLAVVFFYIETTTLKVIQYTINTNTFSSAVTVKTTLAAELAYDVTDLTVNTSIYPGIMVAYNLNSNNIELATWDIRNEALGTGLNGLIPQTVIQSSNVGNTKTLSLVASPTGTDLMLLWHNTSDKIVRARSFSFNAALYSASETAISTATTDNGYNLTAVIGSGNIAYVALTTYNTKYNVFHIQLSDILGSSITVSSAITQKYFNISIVSKLFLFNSAPIYTISHDSSLQGTYFLVNFNGDVIARFFTQIAGGTNTKSNSLTKFSINSTKNSNTYIASFLRKTKILAASGSYVSITSVFSENIWFTPYNIDSKSVNRVLNIAGGYVKNYDGSNTIIEQGFHLYPEAVSVAENGAGAISGGTRAYKFVWEWTDNNGQIVRSQTSVPSTVTISTNRSVDIVVKTLQVTSKSSLNGNTRTAPVLAIYRTLAGGTTYYRVNQLENTFVYNNQAVETISFNDNVTDTALQSNAVLFTTGGVFDNIAIPSCNVLTLMKNRVIAAGCDTDPNMVYVSKEKEQGLGIEFSQELAITVDSLGGDITALAAMDDKILIFKKSMIFFIAGQGADKLGNGSFTTPQLLSADVGCSKPQTIVLTADGVMFQSQKGIFLVNRQLSASYVGGIVRNYDDLAITSASNLPDQNNVCFTSAEGTVLTYDTLFKTWTTFSNLPATAGVSTNSVWFIAGSKGAGKADASYTYDWNGESIISTIKTAWISVAGIEGFSRVYGILLLGSNQVKTDQLKLNLYYDFREFNKEQLSIQPSLNTGTYGSGSGTYGSESPYGGTNDGTAQFLARPKQQKCTSIQIELKDDFPQGVKTEGFIFSEFVLVVGTKQGYNKNLSPITRRFR